MKNVLLLNWRIIGLAEQRLWVLIQNILLECTVALNDRVMVFPKIMSVQWSYDTFMLMFSLHICARQRLMHPLYEG